MSTTSSYAVLLRDIATPSAEPICRAFRTFNHLTDADAIRLAANAQGILMRHLSVDEAKAWMELGLVTAPEGGMVELAVYRWVRIEGINDAVFTKVWSESRLVLRGVNRTILREAIDSLVAKFAADYLRAKKGN